MRESIIQTAVNKFLTWLSKKSVTALYKQTHFWVFSWGLDEHTDLYLFSEESYHDRHRFGLHEETYYRKTEPTISKMEQVDKDINVRSKDEPTMRLHEWTSDDITFCTAKCEVKCFRKPKYIKHKDIPHSFSDFSNSCVEYEPKDEPQTNKDFKVTYTCSFTECDNFKNFGFGEKCIECKRKQSEAKHKDEPQTDCAWK